MDNFYEYPINNSRLAPVSDTEFILLNTLDKPSNRGLRNAPSQPSQDNRNISYVEITSELTA